MIIENFIWESQNFKSCFEASDAYLLTLKKNFGIDRVVYSFLTDHLLVKQKSGHGLFSNYPVDWLKYYQEKKYIKVDPVVKKVLKLNRPFSWENLVKEENLSSDEMLVMNEASDAGLYNGVGIPIHGARGEVAGTGLAFSDHKMMINSMAELSIIFFLTQAFHDSYCSLLEKNKQISFFITKKEKEILQWLAIGKTVDEISVIVSVSQETVKFHIKNIYKKLEANSKTLAILKAFRFGLIELDKISLM